MTPRAVGAKRCGAQREPGRDTEQAGPWDRCGAAAGAGGSRRQGTMAMADPEQSPSLGHWERNKKRGKKTTTTDRLQKHREVLTNALGHRPSKIAGEILGRGPAASPGDTEPQHSYLPEGRGRPGTPPATSGRLCAGSTGCGRALPARVQPVPGLWHPGGSAEHLPAARPPPPARQDILFVFFCGAHSQRVMSEVRNAGPPCVMRSDSHF